ncbi:hypothetical protein [Kribbella sp. NPDC004536]|uniref:hypothetical protein n=1 Tax=Kribbella sp. NPDC004536 TaxID=3364106 RepID=UPI0036C8A581
MRTTKRVAVAALTGTTGLALLMVAPGTAMAGSSEWNFCGSTGANWTTSTAGRSGTVVVTGDCTVSKANWRMDVYVNGDWWASSQGSVKAGTHTIKTYAQKMPKPNDKRGNYTWVKITYTSGASWTNVYEEDLGYLPCRGCTD